MFSIMSLANETLDHVMNYLEDEQDIVSLLLVNRRISDVAKRILYKKATADPVRGKTVFLWAAELGRPNALANILSCKVNPNCLYLSSILRSRLMDVFTAQGRRGIAGPTLDNVLSDVIHREKACRHRDYRGGVTPRSLQYPGVAYHECSLEHFGPKANGNDPTGRFYWYWSPIHLAALRGDNEMIGMLLNQGADIEAQSCGLCDCAYPSPNDGSRMHLGNKVTPKKQHPVWTALHVAMCARQESTVRLLLSRGASIQVGGLQRSSHRPDPAHKLAPDALNFTAYLSAAWLGSVEMCKILDEWKASQPTSGANSDSPLRYWQNALQLAASSGHIRTVGRYLLERRRGQWFVPNRAWDPLSLLCQQYRFADARWLAELTLSLGRDPRDLSNGLRNLCDLRPATTPATASLRDQQDQIHNQQPTQSPPSAPTLQASRPIRLALARYLIDHGVDPNDEPRAALERTHRTWPDHPTPLVLAETSSFPEMVELLLTLDGNPQNQNPARQARTSALFSVLDRNPADRTADDLATVRLLLGDHRAPLTRNGDGQGAMLTHLDKIMDHYRDLEEDDDEEKWVVPEGWVDIAMLLLERGAVAGASDEVWREMFVRASRGGDEPCRLLGEFREPGSVLDEETFRRMIAVPEEWDNHSLDVDEAEDLVKWLLEQFVVQGSGGLRVSGEFLEWMFGYFYDRAGWGVVGMLGPFFARHTNGPRALSA
ncbi:ankyrin repeat-containing domain protein [Cercophora scortea]|uniref:Ankyrin repeat-containing domain protein n=1 Tax=Cercophora scortea TaxID=314031 RepID=A0AAE0I7X4_9PEZI|nr:ankyrin repeat-containing domain protein [Cercophora scortea]